MEGATYITLSKNKCDPIKRYNRFYLQLYLEKDKIIVCLDN
jgi:hypothetical protein